MVRDSAFYLSPTMNNFLGELVGQKIIDIGFFDTYLEDGDQNYGTRESCKDSIMKMVNDGDYILEEVISKSRENCIALVLETFIMVISSPGREGEEDAFVDFFVHGYELESKTEYGDTLRNYLFSALRDPEFSKPSVNEMIGQIIAKVEIIRTTNPVNFYWKEDYKIADTVVTQKEDFHLGIIVTFKSGLRKVIGASLTDNLNHTEILDEKDIRKGLIKELIPVKVRPKFIRKIVQRFEYNKLFAERYERKWQ